MAGLKVGKHIPIKKEGEIGGEDVELVFHVLPPDKKMADAIGKFRDKSEEEIAEALEGIFQADKLFPYMGKWDGIEDENGDPLPLTEENFITVCDTYPPIHGWMVEALYEAAPKKREADRGNSKTSRNGISEKRSSGTVQDTAETSAPAEKLQIVEPPQ